METLKPNKSIEENLAPGNWNAFPPFKLSELDEMERHEVSIRRIEDGRLMLIDVRREILDARGVINECNEVQRTEDQFKERYESTKEVNDKYMRDIKILADYALYLERKKIREVQQEAIKAEKVKEVKYEE